MFRRGVLALAAILGMAPAVGIGAPGAASAQSLVDDQSGQPSIRLLAVEDPTQPWVQMVTEGFRETVQATIVFYGNPQTDAAGSTVQFRQPNPWRDYRWQIVSAITIGVLQTVLIAGLLFQYRRRISAEGQARRHLVGMAHLERRAAMGQLTVSLAHELNQPLGAILRNAEAGKMLVTSDSPPSADEIAEIFEDIRRDDKRAGDVIRRMRTLLQKHELQTSPVDVNDIARETVVLLAPDAAARGVRMDVELTGAPSIVTGDRVHLQQVLLNLVLNGMDAMAGMPADRRRLLIRTTWNNGRVDVSVKDRGPGIASDVTAKIFEPFFTTKSEGLGMGMGLSIARSIVEAHGGHIVAENNAHGGATVRFSIPRLNVG